MKSIRKKSQNLFSGKIWKIFQNVSAENFTQSAKCYDAMPTSNFQPMR